ncbi:MAG: hypothetical protein Q9174_001758 [Haloplaca sp. 1 TL-2023]
MPLPPVTFSPHRNERATCGGIPATGSPNGLPRPPMDSGPHHNGGAIRGSFTGRSSIGMPQYPTECSPHRSNGVARGRSRGRSSPTRMPRGSPIRGSAMMDSPEGGSPTRGFPTNGVPMSGSRLPPKPLEHSESPSGHPQDLIDLTPEAQAFRDFAAGGMAQADAAAVAAAKEASEQEELQKWSAETEAALFGDPFVDTPLATRTNEMTLIDSRQAFDGTVRNIYRGKYSSTTTTPERKQEPSLLD